MLYSFKKNPVRAPRILRFTGRQYVLYCFIVLLLLLLLCLFSIIAGLTKVAWNDMQSSSMSHSLVIKLEECGDSVTGFSFLYAL